MNRDQIEGSIRHRRGRSALGAVGGRAFRDEAIDRGCGFRDKAGGHAHDRGEAHRHGHAVAVRADENRAATLAIVAAAAFGFGLLMSCRRAY